jgi:hypothetical protein
MVLPLPTRRRALLTCIFAATTAVVCAVLVTAAVLVPAPAAALPFLIALCIGCPLAAAWELPIALAVLRLAPDVPPGDPPVDRMDRGALSELLRRLEDLPEVEHPLGY